MLNPWVLVGLLLFYGMSVGYTGYRAYNFGVQHEQVKAAKERDRIQREGDAALNESRRRIAELEAEKIKLEDELRKADEEAVADPDAGKPAISHSGVQRLNRLR